MTDQTLTPPPPVRRTAPPPHVVYAGVILQRDDGAVLLVRDESDDEGTRWELPWETPVPEDRNFRMTAYRALADRAGIDVERVDSSYVAGHISDDGNAVVGWYFHGKFEDLIGTLHDVPQESLRWEDPEALTGPSSEALDRVAELGLSRGDREALHGLFNGCTDSMA
ncbi:NUDIX hydrolase [Streptomyces sp. NPDC093589]|uniref:NUDIX hydrolase n=1 Tax=Streptomyces sp. NPDC093589 TaxID=3366043 RepID=UPI003809E76D